MNISISKTLIFLAGAALGSAIAWKVAKTKYEHIAQEEINSVKEVYSRKNKTVDKKQDKETDEEIKEDHEFKEYKEVINTSGYSNNPQSTDTENNPRKVLDRPYIITPEEFGELDGYSTISLIHYADGVLTDDDDEPVENVDEVVGDDYAKHFGEYEDDSVFVRNDRFKCDYEILADKKKYSDWYRDRGR